MEDRISRGLQHYHETCCGKGGRHGRWAYDLKVVSPQRCYFQTGGLVYDTLRVLTYNNKFFFIFVVRTWNWSYMRPRWLLDEDDIK